MTTQESVALFETFKGRKGSHCDLAKELERAGFSVQLDSDDNERSEVHVIGQTNPDGSVIVLGEILGDSEAVIA